MRKVSILSETQLVRIELVDGLHLTVNIWSIEAYHGQSADDSNRTHSLCAYNLDWEGVLKFLKQVEPWVNGAPLVEDLIDALGLGSSTPDEVYEHF